MTKEAEPERSRAAVELGEAIRDCARRLTEPRRLAVTLHLAGHGREEIARMLRWTLKQADNHKHRGLVDLRRCLSDKGIAP